MSRAAEVGTPLPVLLAQAQQLSTALGALADQVIRTAGGTPAGERAIKALSKASGWAVEAATELRCMVEAGQAEVRA